MKLSVEAKMLELEKKVDLMSKALYLILFGRVEEAKRRNIRLLKTTGDYNKPSFN